MGTGGSERAGSCFCAAVDWEALITPWRQEVISYLIDSKAFVHIVGSCRSSGRGMGVKIMQAYDAMPEPGASSWETTELLETSLETGTGDRDGCARRCGAKPRTFQG